VRRTVMPTARQQQLFNEADILRVSATQRQRLFTVLQHQLQSRVRRLCSSAAGRFCLQIFRSAVLFKKLNTLP